MKVIGKEILWKGKFIETTMISYEDKKGSVRKWEAVGRVDYNGVVVIVPVTEEDELVLIRQFRPVLDCHVIEFPAGLIDPGEDVVSAGRRELIEETGYTSDNFMLFTEGVISTAINAEKWLILLAQNVTTAPENLLNTHSPDDDEEIEVIKVPVSSLYDSLQEYRDRGDEVDLRIYGLWELAKKKIG